MSYINIHASACKHILRTVDASTYTYQSHPIDFNTPYCSGCLAGWHREAAPEPEDLRRMGIDHDMEDCAMTREQMVLGNANNITTPAQAEYGYAGEQHMPQYKGEYGIVYDSVEPCTPTQRSPEAEAFQTRKERDGAAPMWSLEASSFADGNGFVGSFSPLQDDGLGISKPIPSTSNSSSSSSNSIDRAEIRARYKASCERNRIGRLMDKMSELTIVGRPEPSSFNINNSNGGEPEHVIWLRQRLVQAQCWNESLGKVDHDFEQRYGFDLLEVEGGLEMCFDAGFGHPHGCFKWVR